MSKRIAPDKNRCQTEITPSYGPFRFGPPDRPRRCENKPTVIAKEIRKGKDGKRGSMSLCESCLVVMNKQMPGTAEIKKIARGK